MVLSTLRVEDERSSRTRLTRAHARISAGALSTPVEGIICLKLVWIYMSEVGCGTNNSAISLGGLVVLVDDRLDPGRLSGTITISKRRMSWRNTKRNLHIHIVGSINSARLHDWCRVQVVGTHTIDNQPGFLGELVELGGVQLNDKYIYDHIRVSIEIQL